MVLMYKVFKKFLLISLIFASTVFAQEKAEVYPEKTLLYFLGLDDTSTPPSVLDSRAADIQNITLDTTGQGSKRNGYDFEVMLDTNAVGDDFEAVTGLYELYKSNSTRTKLAVNGDKIYSWSTNSKTDITSAAVTASGITVGQNNQYVWATALDYAIATNYTDPPFISNGTATSLLDFTGLTNPSNFKAKCVIWWKNYLVLGNTIENGVNKTTRIRWSNVGKINDWDDDDYRDIAALGGQQIEAMATLYDDLYIFLTDSIYKVSLVGGDDLIVVTKVSEGIGCIAKNSVKNIAIGNKEGLIFLSRDKTINYLDSVTVTDISTLITNLMDGLSASRLPYAVSIDDRRNSHYYLAITDGTASKNNLLLDYHYGMGEWSKHTQIDANALCIANDTNTVTQVYFGNIYSFIYQLNDVDLYSDVAGEVGVFDDRSTINTQTASGLTVLYDTSANFTNVTGAIVRITSGTGVNEEAVIAATTSSGIVIVTDITSGATVYSIGDIDAYYTTKWYDVGNSALNKNFGELFVWSSTDTSATMQVYYATDFSSTINSIDLVSTTSGSLWGTAIWGTSTWAGTSTSLTRLPLNTSGRFMKFKLSEPSIDEPMDLMAYKILFWPEDYF